MVLRADTWILFDDGLLYSYVNEFIQDPPDPLNFYNVKYDHRLLHDYISGKHKQNLEVMVSMISELRPTELALFDKILDLLKKIVRVLESLDANQTKRGIAAADVGYSHAVYSAASRRRATKLQDRIYGIVQTYGIACSPDPPGNDGRAKLHYLEDDFGRQLVSRSPLLSQLFLHGAGKETPRRSWLLTQDCITDDSFWIMLTTKEPESLFHRLEVVESPANSIDLAIDLSSPAWTLGGLSQLLTQKTL
ncbi:hypothetical protein EJ04DRAFT_599023 [Polyplosphaeria fusca]|uniref:Uncharacterized protein n=1 Tax=Polyplosphaeria fusca TaxID=682080 RepID=A0A9P4V541_9PLEO|nr:hypothetical protein EJ04DRAFT_599023 [Polyplosphaeria fusca]